MGSVLIVVLTLILASLRIEWVRIWFVVGVVIALATLVGLAPWLAFGLWVAATLLFVLEEMRQRWVSAPVMRALASRLPRLSATEVEALDAGAVGLEGDLLAGTPRWDRYFTRQFRLSATEEAFLAGPVAEVCQMVDDWEIVYERADLPPEVWEFLGREGFFGLVIPVEWGGRGFSAAAHSEILVRLYSVNATLGVTVAVPNSLGPGELLHRYGTESQKQRWLPGLASGKEIPCFALSSPDAGSDASAILDEGIVCHEVVDGEMSLGVRLTFDKRYITLAPVATVIGLAFRLKDPDGLLGDVTDIGVTCALIPRDTTGVRIGRRHWPLGVPFQNGPVQGENVFVGLDALIGGVARAGQGWPMLVECLSAGRGISLPSGTTGLAKLAVLASGAYCRIRHQFGMPISDMQGVRDAIARQVCQTVIMDSARRLVAAEIDAGVPSGIAAAIVKYQVTDRSRQVIADAMDVHGGKGIMLGPHNYLASAWQSVPIGITVEGANILTRSLMIFGQGALRCHPFVRDELSAIEDKNIAEFDQLFFRHLGWSVGNASRAFLWALWSGIHHRLQPAGNYQVDVDRFSSALAVLTDVALVRFGGGMKREQSLGARLGDLLGLQYLSVAVFTDANYQFRHTQDAPVFDHVMQQLLHESDEALLQFIRNVQPWPLRWLLTVMLRPLLSTFHGPKDALGHQVADLVTRPSAFREQLQCSAEHAPGTPIGDLNASMQAVLDAEPLIRDLQEKFNLGRQFRRIDELAARAREADVIDDDQFAMLKRASAARLDAISVDDFASDAFGGLRPRET